MGQLLLLIPSLVELLDCLDDQYRVVLSCVRAPRREDCRSVVPNARLPCSTRSHQMVHTLGDT